MDHLLSGDVNKIGTKAFPLISLLSTAPFQIEDPKLVFPFLALNCLCFVLFVVYLKGVKSRGVGRKNKNLVRDGLQSVLGNHKASAMSKVQ